MRLYYFCVKENRVNAFDYCRRLIRSLDLLLVGAVSIELGTEDARAAVAAEQDAALVKHSQTVEQARAANGGAGLYRDAVEVTDIN